MSGSVMKCLKTYLRGLIGQTRLRILAFLFINYDVNTHIENVTDFSLRKGKGL